jgi:hypothetical protein
LWRAREGFSTDRHVQSCDGCVQSHFYTHGNVTIGDHRWTLNTEVVGVLPPIACDEGTRDSYSGFSAC